MTEKLTKKELQYRWNCCLKTVDRRIKRLRLVPVQFTGKQPLFDVSALEKAETEDLKTRTERFKKRF